MVCRYAIGFALVLLGTAVAQADEKKVADLAKKRYESAERAYRASLNQEKQESANVALRYLLSTSLLNAQRELFKDAETDAFQAHYERMLRLQINIRPLARARIVSDEVIAACDAFVVEAEFWLEKSKSKKTEKRK